MKLSKEEIKDNIRKTLDALPSMVLYSGIEGLENLEGYIKKVEAKHGSLFAVREPILNDNCEPTDDYVVNVYCLVNYGPDGKPEIVLVDKDDSKDVGVEEKNEKTES